MKKTLYLLSTFMLVCSVAFSNEGFRRGNNFNEGDLYMNEASIRGNDQSGLKIDPDDDDIAEVKFLANGTLSLFDDGLIKYNEIATALQYSNNGGDDWYNFPTSAVSQLSDLSDVNTSTPTAGNVLRADGVDWESTTLASTDLSDTADLLYESELDSFSELQAQISDKTLINEEDEITFDIFPVTPSSAPDADYEVANKKYVDDNAGGSGDVTKGTSETLNYIVKWESGGGAKDITDSVIYDNGSNVGIGTAAPAAALDVAGNIAVSGTVDGSDISNMADGQLTIYLNNGASAVTTGAKGAIRIPHNCTLTGWDLITDTSSTVTIDLWADTYANYPPTDADSITNSHEPTVSAGTKAQDLDISDWSDVTMSEGDYLIPNVDANDTATEIILTIYTEAS